MGCIQSRPRGLAHGAKEAPISARLGSWKATGVVGLGKSCLKTFPPEILTLTSSVRVLDLSFNNLDQLPNISVLSRLVSLDLRQNHLLSLYPSVGLLPYLRTLHLDRNPRLACLPAELTRCHSLEKLSMANCGLTEIPDLSSVKCLSSLSAPGNQLAEIPSWVAACSRLEMIDLSHNKIQEIPDGISRLRKLKRLNLDGNEVRKVPSAVLADCTSLQSLALHSNPITLADLRETEGFTAFEQRRVEKFNKVVGAGVLLGKGGFDSGLDR